MRIVTLKENEFDRFSSRHPLHSYYQTSSYAKLMNSCGYNYFYLGFLDDDNKLFGATLILTQKLFLWYNYAYAPRGFLINYANPNLIKIVTNAISDFLYKQKCVFLKIDPPVCDNKYDIDGNKIDSDVNYSVTTALRNIGYNYFGYNYYFETLKPRWNAFLNINDTVDNLFENFNKNIRNKIRKSINRGIFVYQGKHEDITDFYKFVAKKHNRKLSYYQKFAEYFGDDFEIYFAKVNPEKYLENIKVKYEEELARNEEIVSNMQDMSKSRNIAKLTDAKMDSDRLIGVYRGELNYANNLVNKSPDGLIIGTCAIVKDNGNPVFLIDGIDSRFKVMYPGFLIKWHVIQKYAKEGADHIDLNGISGKFMDHKDRFEGLNDTKLGYNATVVEYIGEFDLVINKRIYDFYQATHKNNNKLKKNIK